jgi:predicted metal-binding membrane protein
MARQLESMHVDSWNAGTNRHCDGAPVTMLEAAPRACEPASLDAVTRRDRVVILAALVALTAISWAYVVWMAHDTVALADSGGPARRVMSCCGVDPTMTFVMWVVMMVGMMLPTAAPMILTFATVSRRRGEQGGPFVSTSLFVAGYLLVWTAFSAAATVGQWALFEARALNPHQQAIAPVAGGLLLVAAGLFQLTPVKRSCLAHCRSPHAFVESHWRGGSRGALVVGLRHGLFCAGSCWILMALLFVVGVMNLAWIAALTLFVLVEKVLPWRRAVVWTGAAACLASGVAMIGHAVGAHG